MDAATRTRLRDPDLSNDEWVLLQARAGGLSEAHHAALAFLDHPAVNGKRGPDRPEQWIERAYWVLGEVPAILAAVMVQQSWVVTIPTAWNGLKAQPARVASFKQEWLGMLSAMDGVLCRVHQYATQEDALGALRDVTRRAPEIAVMEAANYYEQGIYAKYGYAVRGWALVGDPVDSERPWAQRREYTTPFEWRTAAREVPTVVMLSGRVVAQHPDLYDYATHQFMLGLGHGNRKPGLTRKEFKKQRKFIENRLRSILVSKVRQGVV